eukprot:tig00021318_g20190.t1
MLEKEIEDLAQYERELRASFSPAFCDAELEAVRTKIGAIIAVGKESAASLKKQLVALQDELRSLSKLLGKHAPSGALDGPSISHPVDKLLQLCSETIVAMQEIRMEREAAVLEAHREVVATDELLRGSSTDAAAAPALEDLSEAAVQRSAASLADARRRKEERSREVAETAEALEALFTRLGVAESELAAGLELAVFRGDALGLADATLAELKALLEKWEAVKAAREAERDRAKDEMQALFAALSLTPQDRDSFRARAAGRSSLAPEGLRALDSEVGRLLGSAREVLRGLYGQVGYDAARQGALLAAFGEANPETLAAISSEIARCKAAVAAREAVERMVKRREELASLRAEYAALISNPARLMDRSRNGMAAMRHELELRTRLEHDAPKLEARLAAALRRLEADTGIPYLSADGRPLLPSSRPPSPRPPTPAPPQRPTPRRPRPGPLRRRAPGEPPLPVPGAREGPRDDPRAPRLGQARQGRRRPRAAHAGARRGGEREPDEPLRVRQAVAARGGGARATPPAPPRPPPPRRARPRAPPAPPPRLDHPASGRKPVPPFAPSSAAKAAPGAARAPLEERSNAGTPIFAPLGPVSPSPVRIGEVATKLFGENLEGVRYVLDLLDAPEAPAPPHPTA